MRNRQANGLSKSGRYKAEDTARLKYIHCTGFPLIQKGLLPLAHDMKMLELGPLDTLRGQDKVNLEQWVSKHYSDPRSKNKVKLNDMQQTSILEWCSLNIQHLSKPSSVPVGVVSLKCKMGFGAFTDWTVEQMVTSSDQTKSGQTAGAYLRWICTKDGSFNWTWTNVKHVQLLWGLWGQYCKRKQRGLQLDVIVDTHGTKMTLNVQHIMDSYSVWLHNLDFFDTAHDDNPDEPDHAAESDGSDPDEDDMEPIFPTDNTVPRGTLDFFHQQVKGMQDKPYCTWPSLWARAPHPACVSDPFKNGTAEANKAFEVYDIHFFSPQSKWPEHGIQTPCPHHGFVHANNVCVFDQ
jgi:hypothetical protein